MRVHSNCLTVCLSTNSWSLVVPGPEKVLNALKVRVMIRLQLCAYAVYVQPSWTISCGRVKMRTLGDIVQDFSEHVAWYPEGSFYVRYFDKSGLRQACGVGQHLCCWSLVTDMHVHAGPRVTIR